MWHKISKNYSPILTVGGYGSRAARPAAHAVAADVRVAVGADVVERVRGAVAHHALLPRPPRSALLSLTLGLGSFAAKHAVFEAAKGGAAGARGDWAMFVLTFRLTFG